MREASRPMRTTFPRNGSRSKPNITSTIRKVGIGGGGLVLLSILFWMIFYQNLPDNFGLNSVGSGTVADNLGYQANALNRLMKIGMIVISIAVMASQWSLTRSLAKNSNPGILAFLLLALFSAGWSIDSAATLLRFTTLACLVLVCFAIPLARWDRRRLQQMALPPVMYILSVSLLLGLVYPDRVIEIGDGLSLKDAWHGYTLSKNHLGAMSSTGVIICLHRWLSRQGRAIWSIAGVVIAFACLLLSRSSTSLFATLVGMLFLVLVMRVPVIKQRYATHMAIAIGVTLLVYQLVILKLVPGMSLLLAPLTSLTGKDLSFSSRTGIWDVIRQHIQAAPYLGTGYGAYWTGPNPNSPSYIFIYLMYFYPTESHNGYLEVVNDLGYVGLGCLILMLFWFMRQALELMRHDQQQAVLYLALLFQQMVLNMSESEWFSRSSTFAVFLLAATCLSRALLEYRVPARPAKVAGRARG